MARAERSVSCKRSVATQRQHRKSTMGIPETWSQCRHRYHMAYQMCSKVLIPVQAHQPHLSIVYLPLVRQQPIPVTHGRMRHGITAQPRIKLALKVERLQKNLLEVDWIKWRVMCWY